MSLQIDILQIPVTPEIFRALNAKARHKGKSAAEYVRDLIEIDILASQSFDEILAPLRREFIKSGMSEDDLDALFAEEREAASRERRTSNEESR